MAWEVEYTDEFFGWWDGLSAEEQVDIKAVVDVLGEKGPSLRRPRVGPIVTSRHANMKELIIQHAGRPYRVLFAFDPRRRRFCWLVGTKPVATIGTMNLFRLLTDFTTSTSFNSRKRGRSNGQKIRRDQTQNVPAAT